MGWILPPGGVVELTDQIARNLYSKPPKQLSKEEQEVVVAWVSGRSPASEAEVRAALLVEWTGTLEDKGKAFEKQAGGAAPPSSTAQGRSVTGNTVFGARLGQQQKTPFAAEGKPLTLWEGSSTLDDAATFGALAKKAELDGVGAMREVKLLITGAASSSPQCAFINTNAYDTHHGFACGALGAKDSLAQFNDRSYFAADRDVVCASVVSVAGERGKTTYALQFLPTDPLTPELIALTMKTVLARAPWLQGELKFHPTGEPQAEAARAAGVDVVATKDLLPPFQPLNRGVGFGVLRIIDGSDPRPPTTSDVVVFTRLPNDLSHTAGVITLDPQTPLSHVNLKAKQNNTPNAYIADADQLPEVRKLAGSVVRFEVTGEGFTLRAATQAEAAEHLEKSRPTQTTTPPRDLTQQKPKPLSALSHDDIAAFGAKTVNAAELSKILPPDACMQGQGVPFAFYDAFMKESGLYDAMKTMMAEPRFATDETYRNNQLKHFRRQMRDTPLPASLQKQLQELEASFPPGTALRLRSSTNNEDLPGFNGAGLYSSRTWDPQKEKTTQKGSFGDVMKDVWSSLWSFRAFEERSHHRIDHFATAMGVLVHPSYDNDGAAGVAVTKNIYDPHSQGLYINVQPTDDAVTSPEGGARPEELLLRKDARTGSYVPQVLRRSNLKDGAVLTSAQQQELAGLLDKIQQHFRGVLKEHGNVKFAMDVEFIVNNGRVRILQARPWVDSKS